MQLLLEFPVDYPAWGDGEVSQTFVPLAIPPHHDLVSHVCAWIFHGDELVLVRQDDGSSNRPGGERRPGETFHEALERIAQETAGVSLRQARLIGAIEITDHRAADIAMINSRLTYVPCFIAEVDTLIGDQAEQRILIEPGLAPAHVPHWDRLMDEMLAYALAVRSTSSVSAAASRTAA